MRAGGGRAGGGMAAHGLRRSLRFGAGDHPLQRSARADHRRAGQPPSRRRPGSPSTSAATTRTPWPIRSSPRGPTPRRTSSTPRTRRPSSTSSPGACWPRSTRRPWPTPRAVTTRPQGDWVGVSARVSVLIYNPSLIAASQLPTSVLQLADPRYQGKLAFAAGETDFQPIVTSVARTYGTAAALTWLEGFKTNAGSHVYPDNETIADEVNRGAVGLRGGQPVLLVPDARRDRRRPTCTPSIAYFAPRDPGYVLDVSRRGRAQVEHPPGGRPELPRLPRLQAGPGDHRPLDQLRVPDRLGGDHRPTRDPLRPAPAELHHHRPSWATARTAISLLKQAGLL